MRLSTAERLTLLSGTEGVVTYVDDVDVTNIRLGDTVEPVLFLEIFEASTGHRWRQAFPLTPAGHQALVAAMARLPLIDPEST